MMLILRGLRTHPAEFFRRVFPLVDDLPLKRPETEPPQIIAKVRGRLDLPRKGSIQRSHLAALDSLRFRDPLKAAEGVERVIEFIDADDLPFALGIWASSQRRVFEFDQAIHALSEGLQIAEQRKSQAALGDLLLRRGCVAADHGDYYAALEMARDATDRYARACDWVSVGRTFVDRGAWLYYLERYNDAIAMQEQALSLLTPDQHRNRFAALQGLALYYQALEDFDAAEKFSADAMMESEFLAPIFIAQNTWFRGVLASKKGSLEESELLLQSVVGILKTIHLGDAALATIDLAEVQLDAEKPQAAYESVNGILPLLAPLGGNNRIVRSAETVLRDLMQRGKYGMRMAIVDELRSLVSSLKRERHFWRSLMKSS